MQNSITMLEVNPFLQSLQVVSKPKGLLNQRIVRLLTDSSDLSMQLYFYGRDHQTCLLKITTVWHALALKACRENKSELVERLQKRFNFAQMCSLTEPDYLIGMTELQIFSFSSDELKTKIADTDLKSLINYFKKNVNRVDERSRIILNLFRKLICSLTISLKTPGIENFLQKLNKIYQDIEKTENKELMNEFYSTILRPILNSLILKSEDNGLVLKLLEHFPLETMQTIDSEEDLLLHRATRQNNTKVVMAILSYHCDLHIENKFGEIPLVVAASVEDSNLLKILMKLTDLNHINKDGKSVLDLVIQKNFSETNKNLLIRKGAKTAEDYEGSFRRLRDAKSSSLEDLDEKILSIETKEEETECLTSNLETVNPSLANVNLLIESRVESTEDYTQAVEKLLNKELAIEEHQTENEKTSPTGSLSIREKANKLNIKLDAFKPAAPKLKKASITEESEKSLQSESTQTDHSLPESSKIIYQGGGKNLTQQIKTRVSAPAINRRPPSRKKQVTRS